MAKKQIDWEAIEKEYRLGVKSMRAIAAQFNTTAGAISKKAKQYSWVQDKSAEVRQKTRAALLKETAGGNGNGNTITPEDIEKAVQTNIQVIRDHKKGIRTSLRIVDLLQGQLLEAAKDRDDINEVIIDDTTGPDGKVNSQRRAQLLKAVSIPGHAGVLRDLSIAQKNLISLERQAFNLDDHGGSGDTIEDRLKRIVEGS